MIRYYLTKKSTNKKTGKIAVLTSSKNTCSNNCPFKDGGCYAKYGPLGWLWDKITKDGKQLKDFDMSDVKVIRLFQAGDLPGVGDGINLKELKRLIKLCKNKTAFGYTHKPLNKKNIGAIKFCNENKVCINLSADNLTHADKLYDMGIAPVSVVLAKNENTRTPKGRKVVVCPAAKNKTTCETCGNGTPLCSKVDRKVIIGFPAHGTFKSRVIEIAKDGMMVSKSDCIYLIKAKRNKSQFGQLKQDMRCKVLDAHRGYILVESLKRYNKKYLEANVSNFEMFKGMPVRRINKSQIISIVDEKNNLEISWETLRRREGTIKTPGRFRGGK